MALIDLHHVSLAFAGPPVLDAVSLRIEAGERLGLLGRNGAGKSTLLQILEGALAPQSGEVIRQPGLEVAGLPQEVPLDLAGEVGAYLHEACGARDSESAWQIEARIDQVARDLKLDPGASLETLSAGSKRRVLLAAALVRDPDLLVLDEPTNHLDLEAIEHLEEALLRRRGALIFVTHDRAFLDHLATRILELDRGALRSYRSTYDAYLEQREEELRVEEAQHALFDKKLAQEEAWLRRGIKARRTRNEGRVRELEALRGERRARRETTGRVRAQLQEAERSGRAVLRCENLGFAYDDRPIVRGLTTTIQRGDRIGILGPNGCGKTTLIRLLLGEIAPQQGTITAGTRLEVAHFAQLHEALDESLSVLENVAGGRETIAVGEGERHVTGYLGDFLFTPEQMRGPVSRLSGGERKRLQLARVLARPFNVLVLDEPTNDLDLETLEKVEDLLLDFQGTLLVVSHDRSFLDNVVTSTLAFEGDGQWREYVGGYEDWLRQRKRPDAPPPVRAEKPKPERPAKPRRIGFNEQRELGELPARIEALEAERASLFARMASPAFYAGGGADAARAKQRLAALDAELQQAYSRWMELESIRDGGQA